jgi:sugar phosphate isomerase/epimerase
MNKIGLKLWNINTDNYFDEAKKLYDNGIFDYIELYIVPNNLDKLDKWKELDIPFDIHAPHFAHKMNLSKKEYKEENYKKYLEVKRYADELNSSVIVFHSGSGGNFKETSNQLSSFNDKRILIENKPYQTLEFVNEPYYVGAKYEELKYIIDNACCGFCLDIGHCICAANSFNIEPYSYIEQLLTLNPKRIHLSDIHINTTLDEHLHYGAGTLDFNRVLQQLPLDINITIETKKESKEVLDDYKKDVEFLRSRICNFV